LKNIPQYLKKYIVNQNYNQYSDIDHACWRFIMRINKAYFSKNAHSSYLKGIEKTGITIDRIPKIEDIDKKLQKFGWSAVGVKGFLPPLIFMDFQSKGILPIACDMRSIEHLTYTPAPDIVHEAAGHSPMIADSDYARYLKYYGEIARKAISSSEDHNLYIAIRELSDIKENPNTSNQDIKNAEDNLNNALQSISYISEAAYLGRINWWTVEYGLIGDIHNPKIYGAGLLSSIGESENCLKGNVKKIPLSIDCINFNYDITEQQPQLFIAEDFKSLNKILDDFSSKMAYKIGGLTGVEKAIKSKSTCTLSINSGIQISGKIDNILDERLSYIQLSGPVQICYNNREIDGHGVSRHPEGFGFPLGKLINDISIDNFNKNDFLKLGYNINDRIELKFKSGILISGILKSILEQDSYIKIVTFIDCTVRCNDKILFAPEWGEYDMVCGQTIKSVFGGPADIDSYFKIESTQNEINELNDGISLSNTDKQLNSIYSDIRFIRENGTKNFSKLKNLSEIVSEKYPKDWLAKLEIYEIIYSEKLLWKNDIKEFLNLKARGKSDLAKAIRNSLQLIE
tara:strand:- start:1023 stop:2732 length:1710 start_codon:yes stop_codon:yes gene_type:complete